MSKTYLVRVCKARDEGQGVGGVRQGDGGADKCYCPDCDKTFAHEKGKPCSEQACPECGGTLQGVGEKGGPGSGNWGHAGRPGLVGGSAGRGGGGVAKTAQGAFDPRMPLSEVEKLMRDDGWEVGTMYGTTALGHSKVKGDGVAMAVESDDAGRWGTELTIRSGSWSTTIDAGSLRFTPEQAHSKLRAKLQEHFQE